VLKPKRRKKEQKALKTTAVVATGMVVGGVTVAYLIGRKGFKELLKWYDERG
jgi:hypothetical protein